MIDEKKLLDELFQLGQNVERHLKDAEEKIEEGLAFSYKNQLAMLKKAIKRVSKQPKIREWIPCNERLPEEHKLYDITFTNSFGVHSDSAIYDPCLKRWFWDADETELVENGVLAWAEKREPYRPEGGNQ